MARPDANFLKLPDGVYFGACVGVSVDSKGNIYVANRGKHPRMEFRPDGIFMRFIGEGSRSMRRPTASRSARPQDYIWFVDAGTDLIVKLDQQARLQMVFGKKPESWTWETHVVQHVSQIPNRLIRYTELSLIRREFCTSRIGATGFSSF